MPMSHFPNGFMNDLSVRGVPLNVAHPGRVYFVNNSSTLPANGVAGSDSNPGTYLRPFSTIDGAINKCSPGDIIMVMPGHIEAVTATSIVPDVNGIAIIGLGYGDRRPLLNFGATTSNIALSGTNCYIANIILKATIDSVVAGLTISGAGSTIDIETRDTSAAIEFISPIVTTATADNLHIKWKHRGFAAGDAMTRGIDLVGCRDAVIDVDFFGKASTSVVDMRTTACDNVRVVGTFYNESAALTKNVTNNTTSTWSVKGYDAKAAADFAGSDDSAVAYTTISNASTAATSDYDPLLGFRVTKVSNLADGAGTDNLFTVTGRCLITSLTGEVTTVIGGAATMKLRDTTNSVDLCAATTIDTDAVGTMYALTSISANILNGTGATPVVGSIPNITGAVQAGAVAYVGDAQAPLTIAHVLDAADTGAVTWILYYKPLTATSSIVAAA